MKKSLIIMLIATLLVGALMVSCNSDISEATSGGDKLVEIKIAGNSKGINAVGSMEDAESYFWYYRAGKNDSSVYRTGQTVALTNGAFADETSGWKPVRSDNTAGLKDSVLGYFSTGDWLFAFAAYKTALTVTDGFATIPNPNESPVYSQASLNVEVSSNTIGADNRVHITVTPTAGGADADALVVFPTDGLKWQYSNSATDANYVATVSGLSGKTAYMNVYYIAAGSTEEVPLARASATISNDSTNPSATFTAFKGYDSTSTAADKFTLNQVTIPASYVGTEYTLVFKVALSTAEGELIGEESTQSVKAYTNGRITISTSGTVAVEDNESQYIVVVDKVSAIQTASENDGKTVTTSAQIAAPAVSTAEVSSTNTSVSTKNSKVEITSTNVSTSEKSAEKTSSVIIPAEGLKDTVKTLTATSTAGEGDNAVTTKTVTVEETSYNIVDKKDTSNTEVPSTFTGFTVNEGDAVISKLSYTMVATTTTTTTTTEAQGTAEPTVVSETTTTDSYSVTNFASENSSEVTYYIIKDYLDTDLVNVTVGYNGSGAQPIFSTTGTPDLSQVTNDESTTGTGYDPETGLIVFKTSHFSDFYVVASNTFVAENTTTGKKYYSLERAIARVENGETIKLLASVNLGSNRITLSGDKSIIFDLGTYTLTCGTNTHGFDINGAELTVKNGNIDGNGKQVFNVYGSATDTNGKYSVLTINGDVQITNAGYAICVFGTTAIANNGYDTEVNLCGDIAGTHGVFVSGNLANDENTPKANDAMILSNVINLESGSSINTSDQAVAMNGGATVNVKEGSLLTGSEAIGLKRGTLNVTGGTLKATGDYAEPTANTNGTEASGAVVSITSTYNYARGIVAEISGGSFESTHGHALSIQKTNRDFSPDALSVSVSNGYFTAGDNVSAKAVYAADGTTSAFLKGGYYSAAPAAALVAEGYSVTSSNVSGYAKKIVEADVAINKVYNVTKGTYSPDLVSALDEAEHGDTLRLLDDIDTPYGTLSYYLERNNLETSDIPVYVDMWGTWGMKGMVDAQNNLCPQYLPSTDETLYRDLAVDENQEGDWISATDIYQYFMGQSYGKDCLYVIDGLKHCYDEIWVSKNVVIDFDGYEYYFDSEEHSAANELCLEGEGGGFNAQGYGKDANITIKNAKLSHDGSFPTMNTYGSGTFTFENCIINSTPQTSEAALRVMANRDLENGQTIIFKDCSFVGKAARMTGQGGLNNNVSLTFDGCSFEAEASEVINSGFYVFGSITIKDCTFNNTYTSSSIDEIINVDPNSSVGTGHVMNLTLDNVTVTSSKIKPVNKMLFNTEYRVVTVNNNCSFTVNGVATDAYGDTLSN